MRWFQHLPGVLRVKVRVIVLHPVRDSLQDIPGSISVEVLCEVGQVGEAFLKCLEGCLQQLNFSRIGHRRFLLPSPRSLP